MRCEGSLVWSRRTPVCIAPQFSCDADVVMVTERSGLPIDVGRVRRLFNPSPPLSR
jgi:hypothetical protein